MSSDREYGPFRYEAVSDHRHRNLRRGLTPVAAIAMARLSIRHVGDQPTYSRLVAGALCGTLAFDPACLPGEPACCDRVRELRGFFASTLVIVLAHQRLAALGRV